MTLSSERLVDAAATRPAVSLEHLNSRARMLTRVDRKYVVSLDQLSALLGRLDGELDVLEIDGARVFRYASTYFDTPDLVTFRAHVQQRRRRYKVRVREYLDTGGQFVEVKYKGARQRTTKERVPHAEDDVNTLGSSGRTFAAQVINDVYGMVLPGQLDPVIRTANRRCTFLSRRDGARVTVDVDVTFDDGTQSASLRNEFAVIETKSGGAGTSADRVLRSMNVRATSVSKYCVGIGLLRNDVAANPWHRLLRTHFELDPDISRQVTAAPLELVPDLFRGTTAAPLELVPDLFRGAHAVAMAG